MRKKLSMFLVAGLLLAGTVAAADYTFEGFPVVRVIFNQQEVTNDVPAVLFHSRTMLPLRKMAELAGLTVERWDGETNTVYLSDAAATVNGEPIRKTELYDRLMAQDGGRMMDQLIREKLVDQEARRSNITVTPAEIDREIELIKQRIGNEAQFQAALKSSNMTLEQLRSHQEFRLKITKLLAPAIPTTDQVLRNYFDANAALFDTRQVHARHILLETEQEAKAIKAELDKGADFAALARAKSVDPSAAQNAGDLGTFGLGMMVPEFERVVFSLSKGAISQPFETVFGWHIAQVLEVTGTAPQFEAMREQVKATYLEEKVQERAGAWLDQLQAKANITR